MENIRKQEEIIKIKEEESKLKEEELKLREEESKLKEEEANLLKEKETRQSEINKIEKQDLLILDDFGLRALDSINRNYFMEIIEDRHGKRSTIIASQLPVDAWHQIIGEHTIADAILDRIVHSAYRINLKGESMRKKRNIYSE